MFENNLLHIKEQLDDRGLERKQLSTQYVIKRLNKSLLAYRQDMESKLSYLYQRKPENVMKRL